MYEILNLGAGVQSTVVLLMSEVGELPKLDCAIFSDTGWEPKAVYDHLEWLDANTKTKIHRVKAGNIKEDAIVAQVQGKKTDGKRWASMPYYVSNGDGNKEGAIRRQCTTEYKIAPIETLIKREILKIPKRHHSPKTPVVRQWFGISVDEFQRQKQSTLKWKTHWFPLVERRISRLACLNWCEAHGFPEPPRSACVGCPYHSDTEWRNMKLNRPNEFEEACEFDEEMRNCEGMRGQIFLHRSCKPLRGIDFRNDYDKGQLSLFQNECEGMCGV